VPARRFQGTIDWTPEGTTFHGTYWEFDMVFSADYGGIESGTIHAYDAEDALVEEAVFGGGEYNYIEAPLCGNAHRELDEVCDGPDWDDLTCADLGMGFSGGTLGCTADCAALDTAGCTLPE
jgi:hypothetical protein